MAQVQLPELIDRVRTYQPAADGELIRRAWEYARRMHDGQLRKSGDPYFIHPANVAGIITELRLDTSSVCAALLHDVGHAPLSHAAERALPLQCELPLPYPTKDEIASQSYIRALGVAAQMSVRELPESRSAALTALCNAAAARVRVHVDPA